MTTTFEDNTEVTLTDLNNVAVDLGDADFSVFSTEKFGVDKLNQITADLVSAGVLRTGANKGLGCEVEALNGKAYVQAGVIVFESGAKIRITEPVEIEIIPGTIIYAFYDTTTGRASIETSETTPAGDYVLLAEVDAEGVLADRRSSCVAKVIMTADEQNVYRKVTVTHEWKTGAAEVVAVDAGTSAFSYIFIETGGRQYGSTSKKWVPVLQNAFCLAEGERTMVYMGSFTNDADDTLFITKEGQYVYVNFSVCSKKVTYTLNFVIM